MTRFLLLPLMLAATGALAEPAAPGSPAAAIGDAAATQVVAARFSASDAYGPASLADHGSAAFYMTLENVGSTPVVIHSLGTPVAGRAEFHRHAMDKDGTMTMEKVESLTLAPHENAILRPGGLHVMLFDLKRPLKADESVPLTFHYNDGAVMTTEVVILSEAEIAALRKDAASARPLPLDMYRSGREETADPAEVPIAPSIQPRRTTH